MRGVKKPSHNNPRQRIISEDEIERLVLACGHDVNSSIGRVGLAFLFSLETAMRAGEITGLTWDNVFDSHVHLPLTKNGTHRDVPLSTKAKEVLEQLKGISKGSVFNLPEGTRDTLFRKAKKMALLEGFTFHDARATALTRLATRLNVMQLAKFSGHRDLRILMNVYYRETAQNIAKLLD